MCFDEPKEFTPAQESNIEETFDAIDRQVDLDEDEDECELCGYCDCDGDCEPYEDDGQPDEAQEWYDFDPDC